MTDRLTTALKQHFNHEQFRPLQREIIESVLSGTSTLAVLPTGGGKSLTYQLPALVSKGLTLVISPLISLIQDQTDELLRKGVSVGRWDSTLNGFERSEQLRLLESGETKIFYTSPESLSNKELNAALKSCDIDLVAIDEAHCYSDWGHSFRPSYLYLPKVVRALKPKAILALTATATRKTAADIRKAFRIKAADTFSSSHQRPNLTFRVTPCLPKEKDQHLTATLRAEGRLPAVVYVMRQEHCEQVAHTLSEFGFKARSYHAGLNTTARAQIQNNFLSDKVEVVVATIAFGMGVDKPNIRTIVHYHLPKSPEGWMQEAGRAGRDGKESLCQLLACGDDLVPLENFIHAKEVHPQTLTAWTDSIFSQGKKAQFSPYQSRVRHDINTNTFEILLAHLEIAGKLKFLGSEWRYIRSWPVTGKQLALTSYTPKLRKALEHIFQLGDRYDTFDSKGDFGISADKLWHTLGELRDQGEIVFRPSGWLWNYQTKLKDSLTEEIEAPLQQRLATQRANDLEKLEQVVAIATSRSCIPNKLAQWFGERATQACGKCSSCLKEKRPRKLPVSKLTDISDEQIGTIQELIRKPKTRFHSNQQLTRFLCGIHSPYLRHYWLNRKAEFGMLEKHPYNEVYAYAKVLLNGED